MGYYTRFELGVDESVSDRDSLKKYYQDNKLGLEFGSYQLRIGDDLTDHDQMKWYEWKEDMENLSKQYPNVLFWLRGDGEEAGDNWKAWFRNGNSVTTKLRMTFPRPDNLDSQLPLIPQDELEAVRLAAEIKQVETDLAEKKKLLDKLTGKK